MRSSSAPCRINIATSAQKIDVDNRISLRIYYRIADNVLKQADIFREEKNIIDLYIMLLRFSSLVSETIPCHRDYRASQQSKQVYLKKKLLAAMNELEQLKPDVQQKINELNRKHTYKINGWLSVDQNHSLEWPPVKRKTLTDTDVTKALRSGAQELSWGSRAQQFSHAGPVAEHFRKMSLNFPRPKEETLSRHSILGPNGLQGQWQPPRNDKGVRYPSNIDITPVEIPSLHDSTENGVSVIKDSNNSEPHNLQHLEEHGFSEKSGGISNSEPEQSVLQSIITTNEDNWLRVAEEPGAMISFETTENPVKTDLVRQPSLPAVLAEVQDLIPAMSTQVAETENRLDFISPDDIVRSESPMQVHISTSMMESFMKLAKSNTNRNLETCGVLAGSLKNRKFYVTALIIPKQESTSDSCQTTNEEEIFEVQDKRSLFPLGWIHTHPTQSCFMSSIDVHTHYSYQIMLPEAVAIVMAPRDASRTHGIFRLTTPGGMSVIRNCQQRGFHPHDQPPGGGPIYRSCTDVYMNPNLKFDVIDLR